MFDTVIAMARPFVLEITESAEFLEKSLKQAKSGTRKERLQMLWWVKTEQIRYRQEISERLSRSPATLTRWLSLYRQGGLAALLEEKKPPGATPQICGEVLEKLKQRLSLPEAFSSYGAIVTWLAPRYPDKKRWREEKGRAEGHLTR